MIPRDTRARSTATQTQHISIILDILKNSQNTVCQKISAKHSGTVRGLSGTDAGTSSMCLCVWGGQIWWLTDEITLRFGNSLSFSSETVARVLSTDDISLYWEVFQFHFHINLLLAYLRDGFDRRVHFRNVHNAISTKQHGRFIFKKQDSCKIHNIIICYIYI